MIILSSLLVANLSFGQVCLDPDVTIVTSCGTEFDLCLDEYTTNQGQGIRLDVFSNDDLGIFDPCDSDTLSGTKNGSLTHLPDCAWFYMPDAGFSGNDTFYYILNYVDTCVVDICYCDLNDPNCANGKIWTINSVYIDSEESDVIVLDKNGNEMATFSNLSYGDFFFVDGSSYPNNNVNWTYNQYKNGVLVSSQEVHTSCSQQIFGIPFDFFRPVSGCVAPPSQKESCSGVGSFGEEPVSTSRAAVPISTAGADTTIVIITVEAPLPVEFAKFSARLAQDHIDVEWEFNIDHGPAKVELEKSFDRRSFETILMYREADDLASDGYKDYQLVDGIHYYRLKVTESDGNISYSNIISISVGTEGKEAISIYPNPGRSNFTVEGDISEHMEWILFDHSGRLIDIQQRGDGSAEALQSTLNQLTSGVYMLELRNESQRIGIQKLVVL